MKRITTLLIAATIALAGSSAVLASSTAALAKSDKPVKQKPFRARRFAAECLLIVVGTEAYTGSNAAALAADCVEAAKVIKFADYTEAS